MQRGKNSTYLLTHLRKWAEAMAGVISDAVAVRHVWADVKYTNGANIFLCLNILITLRVVIVSCSS